MSDNPIPVPDPDKGSFKSLWLALQEFYFFNQTWIKPGSKYKPSDYR